MDHPIGSCGLIVWDENGNRKWENTKYPIYDCYAMTVDVLGQLWFYFYPSFQLIRTDFHRDVSFSINQKGSAHFAVNQSQTAFLFSGGYSDSSFYEYSLKGEQIKKQEKVHISYNGLPFIPYQMCFRGEKLLFLTSDKDLYGYYYIF